MTIKQRYVSRELTHFIGKELPDDEERYKLLIEILSSGWLTHWPHEPGIGEGALLITPKARISNNEMYNPSCVCFCDIPVTELDIHILKYSNFGISFLKTFLTSKGANPVFYVANKSSVYMNSAERGEYFDEHVKAYHEFKEALHRIVPMPERKDPWRIELSGKFVKVESFLEFNVFSFIKAFDNNLPDEDEQNYYMEREWRVVGYLKFDLEDVYRVILSKELSKRFREDMPSYSGQVTLID